MESDNKKQFCDGSEKILTDTEELYCEKCNFLCRKKSDWNRHLSTQKHKRCCVENEKKYICDCGREYKHMSSLSTHRKKCAKNKAIGTDLVIEMLKQNKEVQSTILEQNKELQNKLLELSQTPQTITNHIQHNVQNNNFNLNVFLNEQCKDAISITDFIDSLQLEVSDLEATGKLGYVLGISRIFINKLRELDIHERPLHCTDIKRETVYIKDKDAWEKESNEKSTLKQVVKKIARKNLQQLPAWQEQNPDFKTLDTPENNEYMKISLSALGAYSTEEEEKDINKIMKNVLKEVVVDKKI
jgi:tRNA G18 (ribose-2'-O)-methylase SpoU